MNQQGLNILRDTFGHILPKEVLEAPKVYDWIRAKKFAGFAHLYLRQCGSDLKMINEADVSIYRKLVDIDFKLGTSASLQLLGCLNWNTRWDIIKV